MGIWEVCGNVVIGKCLGWKVCYCGLGGLEVYVNVGN